MSTDHLDTGKPAAPHPPEPPHGVSASPFGHLLLKDTRSPEEKAEAQLKENARRKGRRTKDWFLKGHPPKP